jgi:kumamolisin
MRWTGLFGLTLGIYDSPKQGLFRGREDTLYIPAKLQGLVTGVFGLDERSVARRGRVTAATQVTGRTAPFSPDDLERHYKFPAGTGVGQQIGIAEFGGG